MLKKQHHETKNVARISLPSVPLWLKTLRKKLASSRLTRYANKLILNKT